ncbi:hypothetical protein MRX96_041994 [Rhipicephalus microplus]
MTRKSEKGSQGGHVDSRRRKCFTTSRPPLADDRSSVTSRQELGRHVGRCAQPTDHHRAIWARCTLPTGSSTTAPGHCGRVVVFIWAPWHRVVTADVRRPAALSEKTEWRHCPLAPLYGLAGIVADEACTRCRKEEGS